MQPIILASQSPRRKQLLQWAEIPFDVIVPDTDESYPPSLGTADVPIHIARHKALAVYQSLNSPERLPAFDWEGLDLPPGDVSAFLAGARRRTILAADTIVVLGEDIIGKPRDRDDALSILSRLSGREHQVITGVCLKNGAKEKMFSEVTRVTFHELTAEQIAYYVDAYRPFDKAGAYAIQEWIGVVGIKAINGDFYNVMGLPVSRVVRELF